MGKINYVRLLASLVLCQCAGIIGSFFTASSVSTWYTTLNKPFFNPPSWVFGPIWIMLYMFMGVSLYLIWNKYSKEMKMPLMFFGIQLGLNALWSIIFFGLQHLLFACIAILLLWVFIFLTLIGFLKKSKTAAYLLIPYLLWVSFATVLNVSIVYLN